MANNENININLVMNGSPDTMVPKKVNMFALRETEDGVVVDCAYNTKIVEKDAQGNNITKVYIGSRLLVSAADLQNLSETITRHLTKTGYLEKSFGDNEA